MLFDIFRFFCFFFTFLFFRDSSLFALLQRLFSQFQSHFSKRKTAVNALRLQGFSPSSVFRAVIVKKQSVCAGFRVFSCFVFYLYKVLPNGFVFSIQTSAERISVE